MDSTSAGESLCTRRFPPLLQIKEVFKYDINELLKYYSHEIMHDLFLVLEEKTMKSLSVTAQNHSTISKTARFCSFPGVINILGPKPSYRWQQKVCLKA